MRNRLSLARSSATGFGITWVGLCCVILLGCPSGSPSPGTSMDSGTADSGTVVDAGQDGGFVDAGTPITAVFGTTVRATLLPNFLGINYRSLYVPPSDQDWPGSTSNLGLAQTTVHFVRFTGGDPDFYDWRCPYYDPTASAGSVCPASPNSNSHSVTDSLTDLWSYIEPFNTPDTYALLQTNVFGTTGWTYQNIPLNLPVPPGQSTAVDDPATTAAWAQAVQTRGLRAAFEIGNEPDLMTEANDAGMIAYTTRFNAQAAAVHGVDAGFQVYGPAMSQFGMPTDASDGKLGQFLKYVTKTELDVLSVHYYTPVCLSASELWPKMAVQASLWQSASWAWVQRAMLNAGVNVPVALTEFNIGPQQCVDTNNVTTGQWNPTLGMALINLDMIAAVAASGVQHALLFSIHGASNPRYARGVFFSRTAEQYPTGKSAESPTPMLYALALWGQMGKQMVDCTLSVGIAASDLGCWASSDGSGGQQILLINKTASPVTVAVQSVTSHASVSVSTLQSANEPSSWLDVDVTFNGVRNPPYTSPFPAPITQALSGEPSYEVIVPPYAAVVAVFR